jgi:hypothetical protein
MKDVSGCGLELSYIDIKRSEKQITHGNVFYSLYTCVYLGNNLLQVFYFGGG